MNYVSHQIITVFLVLAFQTVFSQKVELQGKVVDKNQLPLSYVNVILKQASDSSFVTGTSTDEQGAFLVSSLDKNTYIIEVSFLGFGTKTLRVELLENTVLESIRLQENPESLNEVELVAKRPTIKKLSDRLVFNVENTALTEGSIKTVIENTPGVIISDSDILIRNNTATVYINGRKRHLDNQELIQLLSNTPANNVKSVEVITRPSANYDADGGVVLAIEMGKNLITGYRGSVFTNYTQGVFPRMNYGTSNFFKKGKLSLNINYAYSNKKINRETDNDINFITNSSIDEIWRAVTDRNQRIESHDITANLDYDLSENTVLSFATNLNFQPYFKYRTLGRTSIFTPQRELQNFFDTRNISRDVSHNLGYDLDVEHQFSELSKLKANGHYTNYNYSREQDVNSMYFDRFGNPDDNTAFNTEALQSTEIFTAQVDFETAFSETAQFSTGVKGSFTNTDNDLEQFDLINGMSLRNTQNSDVYTYDENIYAAYFTYSNTFGAFDFNGGLRVENTDLDGNSTTSNITTSQNYTEWFPTASLGHTLSESVYLTAGFKRIIERPAYNELNPFRYFITDNVVAAGNPFLQPSFDNQYTFEVSVADTYIFELYYSNKRDGFYEIPLQDNANNLQIYTPLNIGETNDYGIYMLTYQPLTSWWFAAFEAVFYNVENQATFQNQAISQDLWTFYLTANNNFTFLKDQSLTATLLARYIHDQLSGFNKTDPRFQTQLSLKKTLFNNKASLSLILSDIFNEEDYRIQTKFLDQDNATFFNQDNRYIQLGFTYKFGNTGLKTNQKEKENAARNRLKDLEQTN